MAYPKLTLAILLRRFNDWLASSIVNRLTYAAVLLTMTVVGCVGLVATTMSYLQIQGSVRNELEAEAKLMAEYLSNSLSQLSKDLNSLSASPLVTNALLDSQGRDAYLSPFLRNYRSPLNVSTTVPLYDYQGGEIAGSNPGARAPLNQLSWLPKLLSDAASRADILSSEAGNSLRIAYPVVFPSTGLAEGVLVGEIDLNQLYRQAVSLSESRFAKHFLSGPILHLGQHEHADETQSLVVAKRLQVALPLDALDLRVEVVVSRQELVKPLYRMAVAYFVVLGILLAVVIWITRRMVKHLTKPLVELSQATEGIAASNLATVKIPVNGHDEVAKLARSFNDMIDGLNDSYRMLELQVEKRTRSLRATEGELRAQQRDYLLIFDTVRAAVAYLDREGRVVRANHRACEQIGRTHAQIIGKTALDLFPPDLAGKYHQDNLDTLASGEARCDLLERRPVGNGEIHWFLVDRIPSFDESGNVSGLTVFMMDINDRVEMEAQLKLLNETLEQRIQKELAKNREKDHLMIQQSRLAAMGEMIGNIAHQWRQPLNTLGLILENIKDSYEFNELNSAYLNDATEKGQRLIQKMSSTIDDFRNFFRPNRTPQGFSLVKSVGEALDLIDASFRNNEIVIDVQVRQDAQVRGFPNEYSQVLLNLLNNAKDAILSRHIKPPRVTVEVGCEGDNGYVVVRDNGRRGISKGVLEKIFDPYFTTREKGTGIGLYMSKMIVENNMNGRIEVRNIDQGAEFRIVMPLWRGGES